MKKTIAILVLLLPALGFASPNTPALSQYLEQLQCATKAAFNKADTDRVAETSLTKAAEGCVSKNFQPELAGLPEGIKPSTRTERVEGLVRSLKTRASLCHEQKLAPPECVKMFAAAQG